MGSIKSFPNNRDEYVGAEYAMRWLHGRTSGVFAANNNAAVAAVQNSMAVTVTDGLGWITDAENNGVVWCNDTEKTSGAKIQLTVDAADGVLNRIDRVIVEWKTTDYADLPELKILKGTPASTAAAPALTNNTTVRQLSLAQISIAAGTTAITAAMITDERLNNSVCGLVTESVTADTSVINAQFTTLLAQFQEAIAQAVAGTIPARSITLLMLAEEVTAVALGGVSTVNSKAPDEAGNVGIAAGDIPYTSGSESTVKSVLDGKQSETNGLSASTDVVDGDYFPFYDTSASANKKTLWSNIVSKIRSALFGTLNGFLKANGSGTLSAVSTVPVANGGTGGTTAATARSNLGITPANIGALSSAAGAVGATNLANNISYTKFGLTSDQVRKITAGTAAPSGGSNGDIYIRYS